MERVPSSGLFRSDWRLSGLCSGSSVVDFRGDWRGVEGAVVVDFLVGEGSLLLNLVSIFFLRGIQWLFKSSSNWMNLLLGKSFSWMKVSVSGNFFTCISSAN